MFIFLTLAIPLGSILPGSSRTYQEVCTEFCRDYLVSSQVQFRDMVAARVVAMIRVGYTFCFCFIYFIILGELS